MAQHGARILRPVDHPTFSRRGLEHHPRSHADSPGQEIAQSALTDAISNVFDARRQRIIVRRSHVNLVEGACLLVQAI